jgi:two-component system chemotaxis response regulator CheB
MARHDIIVIGASMGGMGTITQLIAALPPDLPASLFVVWHLSADSPNLLPQHLNQVSALRVAPAQDGQEIEEGLVYVAPPDRHLILEPGRIRLTRGPRENRFRPAIDPLFCSAALAYGPRVVGVILTGALDDGTAGLLAVKNRGGVAVVQDPKEAFCTSMPQSALAHVRVDYCLPLARMVPLLVRLAREPAGVGSGAPAEAMTIETKIAREDNALEVGVTRLGKLSPYTCPQCRGVLLQMKTDGPLRFRCHTGHAYTADSLLAELTDSVEEALWSAVQEVEQSARLLRHLAQHLHDSGDAVAAEPFERKANEAMQRAELVKRAVVNHENVSEESIRPGLPPQ